MQKRSEVTRRGIMDAAVQLFSRTGYEAAAVNDICEIAGVSKGAFYHHFPTKQQLFLAIVDDWLKAVDAQLFSQTGNEGNVPQSLNRMAKMLGFVFEAASGQLPMFMEFLVQASRDQAVWNATIAPYRRYQGLFAEMLEKGQDEGSIRPEVNAQMTSWVLISLAVGILLQGVIDPGMADWNEVTRSGVQMILESIQRRET
jgi:AcrR family transcriptional regulator